MDIENLLKVFWQKMEKIFCGCLVGREGMHNKN